MAHMFPTDQTSWFPLATSLASQGFTAFTFDFRGYGESGGTREIARIDLDLSAAIRYAVGQQAEKIVLIGASMGATAALKVAADQPVDGVVALSPPMVFRGLSSEKALPRISSPKLFLVSQKEMNVSVASVRNQFRRTPPPKQMEILPGSDHGSRLLEGEQSERTMEIIVRFLDSVFQQTPGPDRRPDPSDSIDGR